VGRRARWCRRCGIRPATAKDRVRPRPFLELCRDCLREQVERKALLELTQLEAAVVHAIAELEAGGDR